MLAVTTPLFLLEPHPSHDGTDKEKVEKIETDWNQFGRGYGAWDIPSLIPASKLHRIIVNLWHYKMLYNIIIFEIFELWHIKSDSDAWLWCRNPHWVILDEVEGGCTVCCHDSHSCCLLEYECRLIAVQLELCWMTVPSRSRDIRHSLFATGACLLKMHGRPMLALHVCMHACWYACAHMLAQSLARIYPAQIWSDGQSCDFAVNASEGQV